MGDQTVLQRESVTYLGDIQYNTPLTEQLDGYKVLHVNDHLPNTGIGKYIFTMFDNLRGLGIDVEMLLTQQDSEYSGDGIITQLRPKLLRGIEDHGLLFELLSYYHLPRKVPKDRSLYHISSQMMARYCGFADPTIVTCCDTVAFDVDGNHSRASQYLLRKQFDHIEKARRIIFMSEHARNNFLDRFDYPVDDTRVTYLGVDKEMFHPGDKEAERERLNLPTDKPIILNVGSENPRKNIKTLMESVDIIRRNIPDVLLVRIGQKSPESAAIIERLGLDNNVRYIDPVTENTLASHYRAADVFAFPSYYEGFGMPILESIASGCPLVASNATSIPEVAGDSALFSDPFDVDRFAGNLEKSLSDDELRQELVDKGTKRANKFSWENTTLQTLELYRDVLEEVA